MVQLLEQLPFNYTCVCVCVQVHQTLVNIRQGGGGGPVLQQIQQRFWLLQSQLLGLKVGSCILTSQLYV